VWRLDIVYLNRPDGKYQQLICPLFVGTFPIMASDKKRRGRPPKGSDRIRGDYLEVRLETAEKQAFKDAADLSGLDLSAWVRERLRRASRKELEDANRPVAFLTKKPSGGEKRSADG
jgi:hypothetical protein